jgi:NhaA family Na+:H+ antiporter
MSTEAPARLIPPVSERDHQKGPADAPVVLVEYGDYECPYCGRADLIIQELQERLDREILYVFRHFPITTSHPHAQKAAEAAEAAAAQGKFWQMHHLLFSHQNALEEAHLPGYAAQIGLDVDRFQQELQEGVYAERVREDFLSGVRSGANATPTFFIDDLRYDGAWDLESLMEAIEKPLGRRVSSLAQEFTRLAASGGIVLLIATLVALLWANSPWSPAYFRFWETELAFSLGGFTFSESLLEWVNEALMVIFFFVVGLEIKREVTAGELGSPRRAAMPIAAALGGMVTPALFYLAFNAGGPGAPGWGIPMATDIAFTLGLLTLLGNRVPFSLKVFFTALAIADDLGAVLVIAIFYTAGISWVSLAVGAVFLLALIGLNRARVYATLPYALLGIGLWLAFLQSGIHPTIAGVLLALTIPTRSPPNTRVLLAQVVSLLQGFDLPSEWRAEPDSQRQATLNTLEVVADRMRSPAQRLEHDLNPWTTYLILPLFALANAGVVLSGEGAGQPSLFDPIGVGILFGLVLGKPLGISLFSWLAVRLGWAELPSGVGWPQLFSASWLAGIGFTISLFITNAAFPDPALQATAKLAILTASLLAAGLGWGLLRLTSPQYDRVTHMEAVPAAD